MRTINTLNLAVTAMLGWMIATCQAVQAPASMPATPQANAADVARSAAKTRELCFRLSTPAELKALLGAPLKEREENIRNRRVLLIEYPGVQATFRQFSEHGGYYLAEILVENKPLAIGNEQIITLRNVDDLARLDWISGVVNMSLVKLDLTKQALRLRGLPFNTRTQWPPADKLPKEFEPAKLLGDGKNPGLGVRKLHAQGIDGRGVHLAIIDQPLLREHLEYKVFLL